MKRSAAAVLALIALSACKEVIQYSMGPLEGASDCAVSDQEFRKAKAKMTKAPPYTSQHLGTCVMHVDDTRTIFIDTEAELKSFETKRKAAGSTK